MMKQKHLLRILLAVLILLVAVWVLWPEEPPQKLTTTEQAAGLTTAVAEIITVSDIYKAVGTVKLAIEINPYAFYKNTSHA